MKNLLQKTISTLCACAMLLSYIPAQVYADDPVEMPIENQMMIDEQPTEISQPEEELPAEEPQAEQQPAEEEQTAEQQQPSGEQSTEEQPQEEQPAEVQQSAEEQSVDEQPPAEDGPAEEQQSENQASIDQNEESQQPAAEQPVAEEQTAEQPAEEKQEEHPAPAEQSAETQKPEEKQPAEEHPAEDPAVIKQPAEPQQPETTQPEIKQPEEKPAGETLAEPLPDYPTFEIGSGTSGTLYQGETTGLIAHAGKRGEVLFTLTLNLEPEEGSTVNVTFNDSDVWLMRQDENAHVYTFVRRFQWDERFVITLTAQKNTEYSLQSELLPEEQEEQEEQEDTELPEIPEQEPLTEGQTEDEDENPEAEITNNTEGSKDQTAADQKENEQLTTETAEESKASSREDAQELTDPNEDNSPENVPENEQETVHETTEEAQPEEETEQPDPLVITGEVTEAGFFNGAMEYTGPDYKVTINITEDAAIPAEATLSVREIPRGSEEYYALAGATDELLSEDWNKIDGHARFFDICFVLDGEEIEPFVPVDVQIIFTDAITPTNEENTLKTVHIDDAGNAKIIESADTTEGASIFSADSFSIYGVVEVGTLTKTVSKAGRNYMIRVEYGQDANIPEGSTLEVTEINPSAEAYDEYQRQAALAMNSDDAELLGLYDISIFHDGEKIRPESEVKVSIRCTQSLDVEELKVVHFHEDDDGNDSVTAAISQNSEPETVSQSEVEVIDDVAISSRTVTFQTENFSVFAIAYTVDYSYENKEYHMKGDTSMLLSELFHILNIDADVRNISKVEFTDETLLKIDAEGEDYRLTSLKPFTSNETLTVVMNNGTVYVIAVTDEQTNLNEFITDASLTTSEGTFGKNDIWAVVPDANYSLKLSFTEKGTRQFPKGGETISMQIPSGLNIPDGTTGTFDIPAGLAGTIRNNTYKVENGKIYITFGDDPEDIMTRSSNVHFELNFNASISSDANEIHFNDRVHPQVDVDDDTDVDVSKNAWYNAETGKMEYTVTVRSKGNSRDVTVTDALSNNNLLTFDQNSITIEPSSKTYTLDSSTSTGFNMKLGDMAHNETVTIHYTASINYAALEHNGTIKQSEDGTNSVTVTNSDNHTDSETNTYTNQIKYSNTSKTNTSVTDGENTATLDWKITLNDNFKGSIVGDTITDTIDWGSKDGMKYANPLVLTINACSQDGTTYSKTVTIPQDQIGNNNGQQSWNYVIEQFADSNEVLAYEITYQTIVDKTSQDIISSGGFVKNNTNNEGDGGSTGTGVVPGINGGETPGEEKITGGKKATNVTTEYTDWDIVVVVPAEGFANDFVVVDDIPYLADYGFSDEFDRILSIDGLTANESWTSSVEKVAGTSSLTGKTRDVVTIQFYKDQAKTQKGLESTNSSRTLTIKIRTKNSEEWISSAETFSGGDPRYTHTNTAKVNNYNPFTATAIPLHTTIEKKASRDLTEMSIQGDDGQWNNVYGLEYEIILSNVTEEPIVITDTFDSSVLEFYGPGAGDHKYIAAVSSKNNLNNGIAPHMATYDASTNGMITITADDLPKKEDGSFYEYYGIYYVLQVKDQDTLTQKAIENGGVYQIGNTVKWNDLEDHLDYEYKEPILKKSGTFADSAWDSKDRKYNFSIDINPDGRKLLAEGEGDTLDLTDTHTANLSVDYSTVKIYKYDGDAKTEDKTIQWNFSGNVGTFYALQDQTHYTIEYTCLVTGIDYQEFSNEAEMNGFTVSKSDHRDFGHDASGGADVYQISLIKYKNGATSERLAGATFQLFQDDGNGNPQRMTYGDTAKTRERGVVGKNITFTTNENGFVRIALNQTDDGAELEEGVHYFLKEIESPPGYQIDGSVEYWSFTLTSDASQVNYGGRDENGIRQWIYFSYDDILKMNNTPTTEPITVEVDKLWFNADGTAMTDADTENLVAKVQLKQKKNNGEYKPVKVTEEGETVTVTAVTDGSGIVTLDKTNGWKKTWSNLPRVSGEDKYAYIIEEVSVEGYAVSMTSKETEDKKTYTLKNYKIPEGSTSSITVKKQWRDYEGNTTDNANAPDTIDFYLYQVVSSEPFTEIPQNGGIKYVIQGDARLKNPTAQDDEYENYGVWQLKKSEDLTTTFDDLPSMATVEGKTVFYAYYVKEIPLAGYTTSYLNEGTTRTIINQLPPPEGEYIDLILEKNWQYGDSTTPPEGASATFKVHQLKADIQGDSDANITVKCEGYSVQAKNEDNVVIGFTGDAYAYTNFTINGNHIGGSGADGSGNGSYTYTVSGKAGQTIVLVKTNADVTITGVTNNDSAPPSWTDYSEVGTFEKTVTLPTNQGAWRTTLKNLVTKDATGNKYKYYITEVSANPTTSQVTFKESIGADADHAIDTTRQTVSVTNTVELKGNLDLTKTVVDYPTTETPDVKITVTPPSGTSLGQTEFVLGTDLKPDSTGKYVLTETAKQKLTNIPSGKYTVTETVTDPNGYSHSATYTIDSGDPNDYLSTGIEATVSSGKTTIVNLTNTYLTNVSATKAWLNPDGTTTAPTKASVVFTLYADGSRTDKSITLDGKADSNGETAAWVATFTNLPIYNEELTIPISYTVVETTQYPGYSPDLSSVSSGSTITNAATKLNGTKEWVGDPDNITHNYADEVILTLYRQAEGSPTVETVNASPVWTDNRYEYNPLPKYDANGKVYTYWVTETKVDGYVDPEYSNTDDNTTTDKALNGGTITNKKEAKGKLILTKTDNATGTKTPLPGAKFDLYRVKSGDENEDVRIKTGLTTSADGTITIEEVDPGTYYFVETEAPEGYVLPENEDDRKTDTVNFTSGNTDVEIKNLEKTNEEETKSWLKILKHVTGNACSITDEFTFTVTLYDVKLVKGASNSGTGYEDEDKFVTSSENTVEFTVKAQGNDSGVTINNIPVGTRYRIVENSNDLGYTLTNKINDSPDGSLHIIENGITAEFTNNKDLFGELNITKAVTGNALPTTPKTFNFRVTLTPPTSATPVGSTVKYGDVTFRIKTDDSKTVCTAEVPVTAGQTITLTGIPNGTTYKVEELNGSSVMTVGGNKDSDGYQLKEETAVTGTINCVPEAGQTTVVWPTASFTNEKNETGSIRITKQLAGNNPDETQKFNVTVTITDENSQALTGEQIYQVNGQNTTFTAGTGIIELTSDQTVTISGIPNGYHYVITENDEYQTSYGYDAPQYQVGTGTISTDSPTGEINYLVTPEITVTNTRNTYGSLEISKSIEGNAANQSKNFAFTIEFTDQDKHPVDLNDNAFEITYNGTKAGNQEVNGNQITVELSQSDTFKVDNIPVGWNYTVTEADYSNDGYVTTAQKNNSTVSTTRIVSGTIVSETTGTATIPTGSADTVAYKNTKNDYGKLSIKKVSTGNAKNANDEFTVKVTLAPVPTTKIKVDGTEQTVSVDGITLTIKDGQTKEIEGIPNGTTYTVQETDNKGYTDSYRALNTADNATIQNTASDTTKFTGIIDIIDHPTGDQISLKNVGVEITNTLNKYGNLELNKVVTGSNVDDGRFEFTVTISGGFNGGEIKVYNETTEVTNSGSDTTFTDGTASIKLGHGERASMSALPYNATYQITEAKKQTTNEQGEVTADFAASVTSAAAAEGKIGDGTTISVTFSNAKIEYGDLKIEKNVTGNAASLTDKFGFKIELQKKNTNGSFEPYKFFENGIPEGLTPIESVPGSYTAEITAGSSLLIKHLVAGSKYEITEETTGSTATGYVLANSLKASGSINENTINIASFTNRKNLYGALKLMKITAGNDADYKGWFAFKIQVKDKDGKALSGQYDIVEYDENNNIVSNTNSTIVFDDNGIAGRYIGKGVDLSSYNVTDTQGYNVVLTKNHPVVIYGLPNDAEYTIEEESISSYTSTVTTGTSAGTIAGYVSESDKSDITKYTTTINNPVAVTFTNTRNYYGQLKILKLLEGNATSSNDSFDIYMNIMVKDANGYYVQATENFPLGDEQGTAGWIEPETTGAQVGLYKISINGGESRTIYKIPKWTKVSVSEPENGDYETPAIKYYINYGETGNTESGKNQTELTTDEDDKVTIEEKMITAEVTNTRNRYGNLKVTKAVTGNATNADDEFAFTVKLSGNNVEDQYDVVKPGATVTSKETFNNGQISFTLKAGQAYEIRGIANGVAYEVTEGQTVKRGEDTITGYLQESATNKKGTITGDYTTKQASIEATDTSITPITSEFVNHRDAEGSLQINKTLSGNAVDNSKLFTFTIVLGNDDDHEKINKTFEAEGAYSSVKFTNGSATIQLNGGDKNSVTILKLPNGIPYKVTEETEDTVMTIDGYTASVVKDGTIPTTGTTNGINEASGTIKEANVERVTINNELNTYGKLKITKTVEGNAGDSSKIFEFTITLTGTDGSFNGGKIYAPKYTENTSSEEFVKGTATVYLKHGESATAELLPNGITYTVTEENYSADGYRTTSTNTTGKIIGNDEKTASFINTRNANGSLKVTKSVTGTCADLTKDFTLRITLANYRTLTKTFSGVQFTNGVAYVTLNGGTNNSKTIEGLPNGAIYAVDEVYKDGTTWKEIPDSGYEGYTVSYDSNASGTISETAISETTVTNTYTRKGVAKPEVVKKVTGETGQMTDAQKQESFTFALTPDPENKDSEELPTIRTATTNGDATVADGIKAVFGAITYHEEGIYYYTIQETSGTTPGMAYDINVRHVKVVVALDPNDPMKFATTVTYGTSKDSCTQTKLIVTNTYTKPTKPTFEKKIKDRNDSEGTESDWQDSADYDIGDDIPYKLTATLANNVTEYKAYHITFHDTMDKSLNFNNTSVKVTIGAGNAVAVSPGETTEGNVKYTLTEGTDKHSFDLRLDWGNGTDKITDTTLNNATVAVEFTAELNSKANLGSKGNVNAAYLEFSNNPSSNSTDYTQKDAVIAFTYKVEISKVDEQGLSLKGAAFKLEKEKKNNGGSAVWKKIKEISNTTGNKFTFSGLDDGNYILTETKIPDGCKAIEPFRFTVAAEHTAIWDVNADTNLALDRLPGRTNVLTTLTGNVTSGELELTAGNALSDLTGTIKNEKASIPEFEKKIKDKNDSTGEVSDWQDSADYDIGDAVPYRLTAMLADNVTDYRKYHITFHDTLEKDKLSYNDDAVIEVIGADGNTITSGYTVTTNLEDDNKFTVTLTWGNGTDKIPDANLNKAMVNVYFSGKLMEGANLGKQGNINTAYLEYSCNPNVDQNGTPSEETKETPKDSVIAFTYKVDINKVDQTGKALTGAEFKLEKEIEGANPVEINRLTVTGNVFTFTGLDDGKYILTETKVPAGMKEIDPISFTITAIHNEEWKVENGVERIKILTGLNSDSQNITIQTDGGNIITGQLKLSPDTGMTGLTGSLTNTEARVETVHHEVTVYKTDGLEPLPGAIFTLYNGINAVKTYGGAGISSFTISTEDPDLAGVLPAAGETKTLILKETQAPTGYAVLVRQYDVVISASAATDWAWNAEKTALVKTTTYSITIDGTNSVTYINTPTDKPSFEKKIADVNDTDEDPLPTDLTKITETQWQDSADYDIGDKVPYRLKATLADDVSDYSKYTVVFHDKLEKGLTLDADSIGVYLGTTELTTGNGVTVTKNPSPADGDSFDVTVSWLAPKTGDGYATLGTALNEAEVYVYFTATLNESAVLGRTGNVNTACLEYSNTPGLDQKGNPREETERTPDDFVIAFTYEVDINKVDPSGAALSGAEFTLEKILKDGSKVSVKSATAANGATFTFKGLDDGDYILTETKAPNNRTAIEPITFSVTAEHEVIWTDLSKRTNVLTSLTGDVLVGKLELGADTELSRLTGDVVNGLIIKVQKTDIATGEELTGAVIQILDQTGAVVDEWTSVAGTPHEVFKLNTGEEYILHEKIAPEGYLLTADTRFWIDEDGNPHSGRMLLTRSRLLGTNNAGTPIRPEDGVLLVEDQMKTTATVHKNWEDENNRDGLRPAGLEIILLANGEPSGKKANLTADNHWTVTLDDLPLTDREGKVIKYTWQEPKVEGYMLSSSKADGGTLTTLTNTHVPAKTEVSVSKVWADNNDLAKKRPVSIEVQLYADEKALGEAVTLSADNSWTYTWKDLNVNTYEDGRSRKIVYTVAETEVPEDYESTTTGNASTGFVITNTYGTGKLIIEKTFDIQKPEEKQEEEEQTTDFEVQKIWLDDNDDADGNRPESITVRLYAGGIEIKEVQLKANNGWKYHFGDLPKYKDGKPIHYSVSEDPVDGYSTEIDGFRIYNRYQPERTHVTVRKIWNDDDNKQKIRPESILMKLNNGMTVILSEENGWMASITDLPSKVNGKPAEYTWTEQNVMGYELESKEQEDTVTTFTNKPWTRPEQPSQGRKPKTAGETLYVFDEYDTPLGVEIVINHVGDCFD